MKTNLPLLFLLVAFAGCLAPAPRAPEHWNISFDEGRAAGPSSAAATNRLGGTVRIDLIDVRAPYSGQRLAVLRPDGTIAFDAYNTFAKSPASLIAGATFDGVEASGLFDRVVRDSSGANTSYFLELDVTELALDCRSAGASPRARVRLVVTILKGGDVISCTRGLGEEEVKAGGEGRNFSVAFSRAFVRALNNALDLQPPAS